MQIRLWAPLAAAWLIACGDPGTFRPARNGKEHEWVEDRARIAESTGDMLNCEYMGTVEASGDDLQYDISHTAAIHGATHYVITNVNDQVSGYQTDTRATWTGTRSITTAIHDRSAWAKVYFCGRR